MADTPKLAIAELATGQAQKEVFVNRGFRRLEQVAGFCPCILDRDLSAPPGSPSDGDAYIPLATATGDWTGHEDEIAYYQVDTWLFIVPAEGLHAYIVDEDIITKFDGTSFVDAPSFQDVALVNTGGSTPTVLNAITLEDDSVYLVQADVVGIEDDGSNRIAERLIGTFYRDGGGASQQGATTSDHGVSSFSTAAIAFQLTSNDLETLVTGEAATNIEWKGRLSVLKLTT